MKDFQGFDARADAEICRKAMKGLGKNLLSNIVGMNGLVWGHILTVASFLDLVITHLYLYKQMLM